MAVKLLVQGIHGRMGQALCRLVRARTDCRVVAGVDCHHARADVPVFTNLQQVPFPCDVLVDFSGPKALDETIFYCKAKRLPSVICTTGHNPQQQEQLQILAQTVPVFQSANLSVGVHVLLALAQQAAALLGPSFDIEIVEKHHRTKQDAPSGTARMMADALCAAVSPPCPCVCGRPQGHSPRAAHEIGVHAVRGGTIVGDHDVIFAGPDEVITLSHHAASRDIFAQGAIRAALFLAGKPAGYYTMKDLIDP